MAVCQSTVSLLAILNDAWNSQDVYTSNYTASAKISYPQSLRCPEYFEISGASHASIFSIILYLTLDPKQRREIF